jgi:hypothetical protein
MPNDNLTGLEEADGEWYLLARERTQQLETIATEIGTLLDGWEQLYSDDREAIAQESPSFVAAIIRIREILEHESHFCSCCNETQTCAEKYCTRGESTVCDKCLPPGTMRCAKCGGISEFAVKSKRGTCFSCFVDANTPNLIPEG